MNTRYYFTSTSFFHGLLFAYNYNLSNDFGLELRLPYSYDFSKVTSCFKKFVAGSGRFSQLLVQVLKVGIIFWR
jgi:hypothetical protein